MGDIIALRLCLLFDPKNIIYLIESKCITIFQLIENYFSSFSIIISNIRSSINCSPF